MKKNFSTNGYNVTIVGKNVPITDGIRNYVMEKLSKVDRFTQDVLDVAVNLEVQKVTHTVSISLNFIHFHIHVHASMDDLYAAIDKATEKLTKLIRKYKNKLQDHHKKESASINLKVDILSSKDDDTEIVNEEIEEENFKEEEKKYSFHKVVAKKTIPLKSLTQAEAIMKIELSGDRFLVYKGEEDRKLKVIYRRDDDELGVIEVE